MRGPLPDAAPDEVPTVSDLIENLHDRPSASLTGDEAVVRWSHEFLLNYEMGGWMYNYAGEAISPPLAGTRISRAADALNRIGSPAGEAVRAIGELIDPLVQAGDAGPDETWGDIRDRAGKARLVELEAIIDREYDRPAGDGSIEERLEAFALVHLRCRPDRAPSRS